MTLRSRLFIFFGGLVALLVGAEWWLVQALTDDLEDEVGEVAFEVGSSVMNLFAPERVDVATPVGGGAKRGLVVRAAAAPVDGDHEYRASGVLKERVFGFVWREGEREQLDREALDAVLARGADGDGGGQWTDRRIRRFRSTDDLEGGEQRLEIVAVAEECALLDGDAEPTGVFIDSPLVGTIGAPHEGEFSVKLMMHLKEDVGEGSIHVDIPHDVPASAIVIPSLASFQIPSDGRPVSHTIPIPRRGFDKSLDTFSSRLLLGSFAILGLGLVVAGWVAHRVTEPLRGLSRAARDVGDGQLGVQVPVGGDLEMHETLRAFNTMSTRLSELDAEAQGLREREHLTEIGEVARGIAHTMRNPLNVLGLSVEELASRVDPGGGDNVLVDSARAQIQRIDRSLCTFLSLSSGAGGTVEAVDVGDLARDVALELLQDTTRDVRVRVDARDGSEVARLDAVAPEVRAVLHVLVVNAVEASAAGDEVLVRVRSCDSGVRVEVDDDGSGLAPDVRERLFTPHLTTKENGAGMGLFLARRIATSRYGGTLTLAPKSPRGTRAVLELRDRKSEPHA